MCSQTLEDVILALLFEEKIPTTRDIECDPQPEIVSYSRCNCSISAEEKGEMKCHYCKKIAHKTWNCRFWANNVLKGKLKDEPYVVNVVIIEDPWDVECGGDLSK